MRADSVCPVVPFERAGVGYAASVAEWLANPHAYFKAFGPEARAFLRTHRSERLRTMTLVASAESFVPFRPVCVSVDGLSECADTWEKLFSIAAGRLIAAHPQTFAALQEAGELAWLGCAPEDTPVAEAFAAGALKPSFSTWADVIARVQWMFLMCGIRLNEVIVQVDPYTDEQWQVRAMELKRKRAEAKAFRSSTLSPVRT